MIGQASWAKMASPGGKQTADQKVDQAETLTYISINIGKHIERLCEIQCHHNFTA
jgi:hypothetical protein